MLVMENRPVEESDLHLVEAACDNLAASDSVIASILVYLESSSFVVALGHIYSIMSFSVASRKHAKELGHLLALFPFESKCTICDVAQSHFNACNSPLLAVACTAMGLQTDIEH